MPSSTYSLRQLKDVSGGDHVCFLCASPEERWRVLGEFYRIGLEKQEKFMFFSNGMSLEEVINGLKTKIPNIQNVMDIGQFQVLHYTEIYMEGGIFDTVAMTSRLNIEINKCIAAGYSGLRVCGDMSWVHKEDDLTQKLIRYESQINHAFPINYSSLCMYDMSVFKPEHMLHVLTTHPQAIINEKLYQNIYYMPPEEHLGPDINKAMLDRWMHNIEERKNVEEQLIASKMEAEKAANAKSNFLATMSHEIRNPTNGIIGSIDMLARTQITPEQREYINIIQASSKHLYRVVNDVLDFSKIESGKLQLSSTPLNIHDLLEDSIRLCQYSIQKNLSVSLRYHYHPSCPEVIVGDETRLRQILVNLIGNACKFTEEGEVVVYVTPEFEKSDVYNKENEIKRMEKNNRSHKHDAKGSREMVLEFSVSDSGVGIDQKDQLQLFQKFTQIDVTRKWAGTGLGLAICKQLVESMGGQIMVKSSPGEGSTFYFRIPVVIPLSPPIIQKASSISSINSSFSLSDSSSSSTSSMNNFPTSPLLPSDYLPNDNYSSLYNSGTIPIPLSPSASPSTSRLPLSPFHREHHPPLLDRIDSTDSLRTSGSSMNSDSFLSPTISRSSSMNHSPSDQAYDFSDEHVLIVEDDTTNQKVLNHMLQKLHCHVTMASNGLEALKLAAENNYTLIITDQYMPAMDGLTAVTRLRAELKERGRVCPPAVVCTGTDEPRLHEAMDDVLVKPVRFRTLVDTMLKFCTNKAPG